MNHSPEHPGRLEDQLAKLGRYEALLELTAAINASADIFESAQLLARRLKYVADVFAWRYISVHEDAGATEGEGASAMIIDGFRGRAQVLEAATTSLSDLETALWDDPRARVLCEGPEDPLLASLPDHFRRADVSQIYAHPLVGSADDRALFLLCKRREPFNELDLKLIALAGPFFHRRVHMLRARQALRRLEMAYLEQEMTLRQSEKLATLGRLSAGMAHELNNPASAARRSGEQLREVIDEMRAAQFRLGRMRLTSERMEEIRELEREACARATEPEALDPLARSDREQELEDWLDGIDVEDPWEVASRLVSMGHGVASLRGLAERFEADQLEVVLSSLSSHYTVHRLLEEIGQGTGRITGIVRALKSYSYLDQAEIQAVDVRQGLDDTLVMLRARLKGGVAVDRDYAGEVPSIEAFGGELNQVWTNLIDNAVTAMGGRGSLVLRVRAPGDHVVVEVVDDGPGIPVEVQPRVFDPFFTTKPPGEGTGLGLSISHNIVVEKHGGELTVDSRPGETRFAAKLPLTLKRRQDDARGEAESASATADPSPETPGERAE